MNTILCPIDFTDASINGLNYAFEIAKHFSCELVIFHSIHIPVQSMEGNMILPVDLYETEGIAKDKLLSICNKLNSERAGHHVHCHYIIKFGLAEDEIMTILEEQKIDMVIMGTKGARGIEKLLGTVASEIAEIATCPVIIVPESYLIKKISEITYAIDLDDQEESILNYISNFAAGFNAHLSIVNIQTEGAIDDEKLQNFRLFFREKCEYSNVSFDILADQDITDGINKFALSKNSDLIVMAPHHRNFVQKLFTKSNTKSEAFQSTLPIMALHKADKLRF